MDCFPSHIWPTYDGSIQFEEKIIGHNNLFNECEAGVLDSLAFQRHLTLEEEEEEVGLFRDRESTKIQIVNTFTIRQVYW